MKAVQLPRALSLLALLFGTVLVPAQSFTVTVVTESGDLLSGVDVATDNRSFTGKTGADGTIEIPDIYLPTVGVQFSLTGFKRQFLSIRQLYDQGLVVTLERSDILQLPGEERYGRRLDPAYSIPGRVKQVDQGEVQLTNSASMAEVLEQHLSAFVQRNQTGGGSPILQGLGGNRVLLLVDGVRLNNALFDRNRHPYNRLLNVIGQGETEILFGPQAVFYGNNAMGGVINFKNGPNNYVPPINKETNVLSQITGRFASANVERSGNFDLSFYRPKWTGYTNLRYSDFGDLMTGLRYPDNQEVQTFGQRPFYQTRLNGQDTVLANNSTGFLQGDRPVFLQRGTAFTQYNILQKLRLSLTPDLALIGTFQLARSSGVANYPRLTDTLGDARSFLYAESEEGPQRWWMGNVQLWSGRTTKLSDRLHLIAAFQRWEEAQNSRFFGDPIRLTNQEAINIASLNLDIDKPLLGRWRHLLSYGLEGNYQQLTSTAELTDINTNTTTPSDLARYPTNGSSFGSWGAYVNYNYSSPTSRFRFLAGGRVEGTHFNGAYRETPQVDWPQAYLEGIQNFNLNLAGHLSIIIHTVDQWKWTAQVANAFHAPTIADMARFEIQGTQVWIPNPDLQPEQSFTGSLGISKVFGDMQDRALQIQLNGFYSYLLDVFEVMPTPLPDGRNSLMVEGATLQTIAYQNGQNGFIYGGSGALQLVLSPAFSVQSEVTYTYGRQRFQQNLPAGPEVDTLLPATHIPPIYGRTSLRYRSKKVDFSFVWAWQAAKAADQYGVRELRWDGAALQPIYTGSPDQIEQGVVQQTTGGNPPYQGVYAWNTINFYTRWQPIRFFEVTFGVENILDLHYRTFSSGLSAPGLNFLLSGRVLFGEK